MGFSSDSSSTGDYMDMCERASGRCICFIRPDY